MADVLTDHRSNQGTHRCKPSPPCTCNKTAAGMYGQGLTHNIMCCCAWVIVGATDFQAGCVWV